MVRPARRAKRQRPPSLVVWAVHAASARSYSALASRQRREISGATRLAR